MATYQPRPERNIKEVNEAKAARRAEIERRCAALDPPLLPGIMRHMDSFQAAMQISQPMTDQAWEILRPRLLSQLPYAERREKEQIQHTEILAEEYRQRRQQEAQLKETKENLDREWETHQAPVRHRIGVLAAKTIESRWAGGKAVTKESSPKFAADVLLDVRQRFYAAIAQEDQAALAAGEPVKTDPPNGPPTRKLILENMKWLFDTKIKPLTDHFQRELFLCNGCDGNFKFYGFEGVIQHYAAKHTTTLSMGNIVVHWRSEWPEHPPFNPNPSVAKTNYYKIPTPAPPVQPSASRESRGPSNFVQPAGTSAPTGASLHQTPQHPAVGHQNPYPGPRQQGRSQMVPAQSYPPTNSSHSTGAGYSGAHNGYGSSAASYNPFPVAQQGQTAQYGSFPGQQGYLAFPQGQLGTVPQGYFPESGANNYGGRLTVYPSNFQKGPLTITPQAHNAPGQVSDLYQRQMDEMAKHAKDVFTAIGGVKDLPGSVRIHVVIQHTVARFKASFPNEPSLSMFIDGLDHHAVMRPVRSVNGLGCRTCMKNGTGAKLYTLPHLVNHFRTAHVETVQMLGHPQVPELDWKHDMIDYPDLSVISRLLNANGMTDAKLNLIALVFPDAFPTPLPSLRSRTDTGPHPIYRKELDANTKKAFGSPPNQLAALPSHYGDQSGDQSFNRPHSAFRPLSPGRSSEPLEPPGEDEYDPHRPAYLGKIVKIDPGSTHDHNPLQKLVQNSPLQDGRRYLSYTQREKFSHAMPPRLEGEQSYSSASVSRPLVSETYPMESNEPFEQVAQPQSPFPNAMSRSGHRFHARAGVQAKPSRPDSVDEHSASVDSVKAYGRTPEDRRLGEILSSVKREARGASPPEAVVAADRFLNTLAPEPEGGVRSHKRFSSECDTEHEAPWLTEPPFKRRKQYFGQDGPYDQRLGDAINVRRQENDIFGDHTLTGGPPEPRNGNHAVFPERLESHTRYYDDFRPLSQMPLKSGRLGGTPPAGYAPHEDCDSVVVKDPQDTNGSVLKRPPGGSHTYQISRIPQYRDESASPQRPPAETALYRPRSPVEEDRRDSVYQVRSPSSRRVNRSQRVPSYEYPAQTRYEYVDDPGISNSHYQQRVEYVPIRYHDSGLREPARYVIARPVEEMGPEYVRYDSSCAAEPAFERNAQVYHTPQRAYHGRQAPSFAQSHQY